jgi:hypothetical protein
MPECPHKSERAKRVFMKINIGIFFLFGGVELNPH